MNGNHLNTGTNSASFRREPTKAVKEVKEKRAEQRGQLMPAASMIMPLLDKEIDDIKNVEYIDLENLLNDEHFRAELMARKKYIKYVKDLKVKLDNILREKSNG